MKKNKILIITSSVLVILAAITWIYFKVLSPKNDTHSQQQATADMKNMNMHSTVENKNMDTTAEDEKVLYTCSMHPHVILDEPGNCPICGMQLIRKETHGELMHDISLHTLLQPANTYAVSAIQATTIKRSVEIIRVNALGYTSYNTNEVGSIAARTNGRIEKLYIRYRYQKISKGQKIMDIYSPELLTDQQNFLFLLKNDPSNSSLISSAKQRLLLVGFPQAELQQIIKSGKPLLSIPVYSNYSGHIHEALETGMKNSSKETTVMNEASSLNTRELDLREGMYVKKGQTIFKVYNPDKIWALLNIYPSDQPLIKIGNPVMMVSEVRPAENINGTIFFIEPFFRPGSKTLTARVNINNSILKLPIGSQVKGTIFGKELNTNWLPREAVVSLGLDRIVFVKTGNAFKAQKIETGLEYNKQIQITNGLSITDSVASNAQYLIDSESFIKVNK